MLNIDDVIGERIRQEQIEERKCADNICQQEVRKKHQPWHTISGLLGIEI